MLRIGILNFAGHLNHGANLTAYALQQAFSQLGHEAHNLHLHCNSARHKLEIFTKFADEHIKLSSRCAAGVGDMQKFNKDYDVFVVGSDQVWREADAPDSYWVWKTPHYACYHLAFAEPGKRRLAVAASFGNEEYNAPEYIKASLSRELKQFAAISVREQSAVGIVKHLTGVDARQLIDPVFYITPAEWEKFCRNADNGEVQKGRIAYNCFYHHNEMAEILEPLQVDYDTYDLCSGDTYAWLTAIRDSDFVITDSFHVMCFCLIFETPFVCLAPAGQGEARFFSMSQLTGFPKSRVLCANKVSDLPGAIRAIMNEPLDWESIRQNISSLRQEACAWLQESLTLPLPPWSGNPYRHASSRGKRHELKDNAAAHVCHIVRRNRAIVRFLLAFSPIARTFLKRKKAFYDELLAKFAW